MICKSLVSVTSHGATGNSGKCHPHLLQKGRWKKLEWQASFSNSAMAQNCLKFLETLTWAQSHCPWQHIPSSQAHCSRSWDQPNPPELWHLAARIQIYCSPSSLLRSFSIQGYWPMGHTQRSRQPSAACLARWDLDWRRSGRKNVQGQKGVSLQMQVLKTSISIWRWYLLQLYLCNFSVHHYWYIFHSELKIQSYKLLNFGFQYCRYVGPSSNDLHLTGAKIKNDTSFVSSSLMLSVNNLRLIFNIITHSQGLDFLLRKT